MLPASLMSLTLGYGPHRHSQVQDGELISHPSAFLSLSPQACSCFSAWPPADGSLPFSWPACPFQPHSYATQLGSGGWVTALMLAWVPLLHLISTAAFSLPIPAWQMALTALSAPNVAKQGWLISLLKCVFDFPSVTSVAQWPLDALLMAALCFLYIQSINPLYFFSRQCILSPTYKTKVYIVLLISFKELRACKIDGFSCPEKQQ